MHVLGLDNAAGPIYLFWSGFAGDLGLLGASYAVLRKHNCHVQGCPRVGRHKVAGTEWVVCSRHHPDDKPTAAQVAEQHAAAQPQSRISDDEAARIKAKWLSPRGGRS
jgi:hypothetical protein